MIASGLFSPLFLLSYSKRMAKDDVLFGYALLDDTMHTVSIDDIDRPFTRSHKFYCPHCHNEMYATFGEVQMPHFRHNGDKCQQSKYLHDLAEHVFYEEYSKCLDNGWPFLLELLVPMPCNKACVLKKHADCKEHYIRKTIDLTKEYTLISLETRVDLDNRYRRPDILLESVNGKQLWVEIWVSHETEEDKRKDGRIIEIRINTEKDLEKIKQHKIVQSEGEGLAVRIFSIDTEGEDVLFAEMDSKLKISYPCEKFFCFEVGKDGWSDHVLDSIKTVVDTDLYYRVILRLNWKGQHDSFEGSGGEQSSEQDLRTVCIQRYKSFGPYGLPYRDKSFDDLIVSEWKSQSYKTMPTQRHSQYRRVLTRHSPQSEPHLISILPADVSKVDWVDLGLPSGTLWAKEDVEGKTSFMGAKRSFGSYLPSRKDANELMMNCEKIWDESTKSLVFTGPNGNSLSFPCEASNKSYWLDAYEQNNPEFGQCFHIGADGHFWINDKASYSGLFVRLVKRDRS